MSDQTQALRKPALPGKIGGSATVRLTPVGPAARASLRAPQEALSALSGALAVQLPNAPKTSSASNERHALWIGPDEWFLIGPDGTDFVGLAASSGVLHSGVDVSHRNVGIIVSGPGAAAAINAGCPLDLSNASFPVGACARTVLGKIEIILYRTEDDTYRVECWRSFAEYCFGLLGEGAIDAH
ncbi:sarcosine oxidase subunit gamma [Rhizobium alvei]|uniref:Sarcosine oxidase subunit gamma n=1 Tax=Rhizobium alvei TaxID=1132659 RepID=A0ABT8YNT4_9HYPH|nr:sarcosine oxidase subunit gamma [Rhizobium alvei]MDO6965385.1 sarcosine oxidase subunit gamma [Rhizobium alvei]